MTHLDDTRPISGLHLIAKVIETQTGRPKSTRTVQRWIGKGILRASKPGGRTSPYLTTRGEICRALHGED